MAMASKNIYPKGKDYHACKYTIKSRCRDCNKFFKDLQMHILCHVRTKGKFKNLPPTRIFEECSFCKNTYVDIYNHRMCEKRDKYFSMKLMQRVSPKKKNTCNVLPNKDAKERTLKESIQKKTPHKECSAVKTPPVEPTTLCEESPKGIPEENSKTPQLKTSTRNTPFDELQTRKCPSGLILKSKNPPGTFQMGDKSERPATTSIEKENSLPGESLKRNGSEKKNMTFKKSRTDKMLIKNETKEACLFPDTPVNSQVKASPTQGILTTCN